MYIILFCFWIGGILPAYLLGFVYSGGAVGVWIGFIFGIALTNLVIGVRTWKTMKRYEDTNPLQLILSHKPN